MKKIILTLFAVLILLASQGKANATVLVNKSQMVNDGNVTIGIASYITNTRNVSMLNDFNIPYSSKIERFNWWGLHGYEQNIDFKFSLYEGQGKELGNLIYNESFESTDLSDFYDLNIVRSGYQVAYYSYEFDKPLILDANKQYYISIQALYPNYNWYWHTSTLAKGTSIKMDILDSNSQYILTSVYKKLDFAFQLEGNPVPTPEPSSMLLGLMGIGSMLGFRRKRA